MALIFCPNCGSKVSDKAISCVKCNLFLQDRVNLEKSKKNQYAKNSISEEKRIKNDKNNDAILKFLLMFTAMIILGLYYMLPPDIKQSPKPPLPSDNQIPNGSNSNHIRDTCTICSRSLTGKGYTEVFDGVWDKCEDPYQCYICSPSCGLKHTKTMNGYLNRFGGDKKDGRIYESNPCNLCKGTGIETSTAPLFGEYQSRICSMCNGKGVRSY